MNDPKVLGTAVIDGLEWELRWPEDVPDSYMTEEPDDWTLCRPPLPPDHGPEPVSVTLRKDDVAVFADWLDDVIHKVGAGPSTSRIIDALRAALAAGETEGEGQ